MKRWVLGITGGIASGKSTVLALLSRRGVPILSSDVLAHRAIRKGTTVYRKVVRHFGREILRRNRQIDRKKLGKMVFSVSRERRWLERAIHPVVIAELKRFIKRHPRLVALDIPLLFEAKLQRLVDHVVVVYATPEQQSHRLRRRDHLSRQDALRRVRAQWPLSKKRHLADHVLMNTRSKAHLARQVQVLLANWAKKKKA